MAKQVEQPTPVAERPDVNPQKAFEAAWNKDPAIRLLVTKTPQVRGGLKPSDTKKARELRQSYGL